MTLLVNALFLFLTVTIVIPQAWRLWVTRDPSGISVASLLNGCVGYSAWVAYLAYQHHWAACAATAFALTVWVGTSLYVAARNGATTQAVVSAAAYALVLGSIATVSVTLFGIVLSLGAVWSGTPAVVRAWRDESISGISVGTWSLLVAESLAWLAWAVVVGDVIVGLYGTLAALMSLAVLAAVAFRTEARTGPIPAPSTASTHTVGCVDVADCFCLAV